VRAEVRHQLKEDRFSKVTFEAAQNTVHWSVAHKEKVIAVAAAVVVVAAMVTGGWFYLSQQDQKASFELSQAVRTMDTPLRPANMPAQPENPSFASSRERATQARKQFQAIADKYPHTRSAEFARYFVGLTSADVGDYNAAIHELQEVASSHNRDLSAVAKLALAGVYRNQHNDKAALDLYNNLIAKPTTTVGKATAQIEQAATYESDGQPREAKRIYQQMQKENPANSAPAQLATEKLQALKQ
jgi:tetratricopeptide (TPR) repeat protein